MRKPIFTGLLSAGFLVLVACEDDISLNVQDSPSIVAEDDSPSVEDDPIFQGVGQEPGWFVRIYDDIIVYDANYGERRVTARTPEVELFDGGRRYENDSIIVEILDQPCSDSMSGADYPAKVTITEIGSSPVEGCGGDT